MSMQFSYQFAGSAEEIFEQLTNPQVIVDRCMALGSLEAECDTNDAALPNLTITRLETAELPSMMKKILGDQQALTTTQVWSETEESYDNESTTKIGGAPIEITTHQSLYNTDQGSELSVTLTVRAKIPLLGKKVEPMVASKVRSELLREFEYIDKE